MQLDKREGPSNRPSDRSLPTRVSEGDFERRGSTFRAGQLGRRP